MSNKILTSTGWLARETIKGLPEAGAKVGKTIGKGIGTAMKFPFFVLRKLRNKINIPPFESSENLLPKEKKIRQEYLNKMKDTIKKWKETNPNDKIPREFRDLE